jgi:hypothetical protein
MATLTTVSGLNRL